MSGNSPATNGSPNHTKSSDNTGRWSDPKFPSRSNARSKRSAEQHPLSDLPDGGGSGVNALLNNGGGVSVNYGDGIITNYGDSGSIVALHDNDNHLVANSELLLSSHAVGARTNNNNGGMMSRKMFDAMVKLTAERPITTPQTRRHRKRQTADVIVHRKDLSSSAAEGGDSVGGGPVETVDIVPLDSERRIRVNLTIASEDGSAGNPVYEVSLSLPGGDQQQRQQQQQPQPAIVTTPEVVRPQPPAIESFMTGAECECSCPCLDDSDDEGDDFSTSTTASAWTRDMNQTVSITTTKGMIDNDYSTELTELWTTVQTSSTSEPPVIDVSCPPPVLLFCDPGKFFPFAYFRT